MRRFRLATAWLCLTVGIGCAARQPGGSGVGPALVPALAESDREAASPREATARDPAPATQPRQKPNATPDAHDSWEESAAWERLGVRIAALRYDDSVDEIVDFLEERAPEAMKRAGAVSNALALQDWWSRGGVRAVRMEYKKGFYYVVPKAREVFDGRAQRQRGYLPLICPASDRQCGHEALGLIRRAERAMRQAYEIELLREGWNRDEAWDELRQSCATSDDELADWASWRHCVEHLTGKYPRFPVGRFKLPTTGTLATGEGSIWDSCGVERLFDLRDGLVVSHTTCFVGPGKERTSSWSVAHTSLALLRETSLLLAMLGELEDVIFGAREFEIPPGITEPERDTTGFGISMGTLVSDAFEINYELLGVLPGAVKGDFAVYYEEEPSERYASDLLLSLRASLRPSCLKGRSKRQLERLVRDAFDVEEPEHQREAVNRLEAQRC